MWGEEYMYSNEEDIELSKCKQKCLNNNNCKAIHHIRDNKTCMLFNNTNLSNTSESLKGNNYIKECKCNSEDTDILKSFGEYSGNQYISNEYPCIYKSFNNIKSNNSFGSWNFPE